MTDSKLLMDLIEGRGLKKKFVAKELGLSRTALYNKLNNTTPFTTLEITHLCKLLEITSLRTKEKIFFAPEVDK